jgi:hypothetical protein
MALPRIRVDFNEWVEEDLFLLSKTDTRLDDKGDSVRLTEGLRVQIFEPDTDSEGKVSLQLVAEGICTLNTTSIGWTQGVKWCCRIEGVGIRHEPWPSDAPERS